MYTWMAVRFLRTSLEHSLESTVREWYRESHECASRCNVELVCCPPIDDWLAITRGPRSPEFAPLQCPCLGFGIDPITLPRYCRWPMSSVRMWWSRAPRLEWEFDEEYRRIMPMQFVRTLLRTECIDLIVHQLPNILFGWNYAVYAWLELNRTQLLDRRLDRSIDEQIDHVAAFLSSLRSTAIESQGLRRVIIRTRRDRRALREAFHERPFVDI